MPLATAASFNNAALEQQSAATQLSIDESDDGDAQELPNEVALMTAELGELSGMTASEEKNAPETETETSGNARETTSTIALQESENEEETPVVQRAVLSTVRLP